MEKPKVATGTLVALAIGLLVGFGVGWYSRQARSSPTAFLPPGVSEIDNFGNLDQAAAPAATILTVEPRLSVANQPAGSRVLVSKVSLGERSWLAVRDDQNGAPGWILGAKRLEPGDHDEAVIELLRPTVAGRSYFIFIYRDDGDMAFDHTKDILTTRGAAPLTFSFSAVVQ